jgi:hypothetical protein
VFIQYVIFRLFRVSSGGVILTRTNVTLISTHTRVISTRTVWCWLVWVRLWHSYVLKPHYAYRNHSYVWYLHAYYDVYTHECNFLTQSVNSHDCEIYMQSVTSTRKTWFLHAECDLYTQSVISTPSLMLKRTNVITKLTTVISTRTSECDVDIHTC